MDEHRLAAIALQSPIDPLNLAPEATLLSSQHLGLQSVKFWWRHTPLAEWYAPPLTHHVVIVRLQDASQCIYAQHGSAHEGPLHAGDAIILRAGQAIFWHVADMNSLCIGLDPGFVQRVALETCNSDPARVELRDVFGTRDPILSSLARLFMTELRTDSMGGQLYAESLGHVLALHLLRTYCTQRLAPKFCKGGLPSHHVRRVVEYINAHLAQPLTLAELAGLLQMSEAHFIRAFRQTMGCTPHHYLIERRIEQAKALLATPWVPISAVAMRVGFQTHSHFTMLFRKLTGVSPTAYRNAQLAHSAPRERPA